MKKLYFSMLCVVLSTISIAQTPFYKYYFDDNAKTQSDTFNLGFKGDFLYSDYLKIDSMTINVMKLKSFKNYRYSQNVYSQNYNPYNCTLTILSDSTDDLGNTFQTISLKAISKDAFGFGVNYSLSNSVSYKQFADCPFDSLIVRSFPDSITQYLVATTDIQSTDTAIYHLAKTIAKGCSTTAQMVEKIVKWLDSNITYDFTFNHSIQDAKSVLKYRIALCEGYSNLMCALLRSVGVASRRVDGYMTPNTIHYSINGQSNKNTSSGGAHSWVEVFYPRINNWISTEPQSSPNILFANYVVFNNGVFAIVKDLELSYIGNSLTPGTNSIKIGTISSDSIYSINMASTKSETITTTGKFNILMSLYNTENSKSPTPILNDSSQTMCDNSSKVPAFVVTNPSTTVTWIQNGVKTFNDSLIPVKPDSAVSTRFQVTQISKGCAQSDTVSAVLNVFKKPEAPILRLNFILGGDSATLRNYKPPLQVMNFKEKDSIKWFRNNVYFTNFSSDYYMPQVSGEYNVVVTDSLGCYTQTSNIVNIFLDAIPEIPNQSVKLSPNPTKGIVTIQGESIQDATVEVYNWIGVLVLAVKNSTTVDLSGYPAGIYSVIVRNAYVQWSDKVVKN